MIQDREKGNKEVEAEGTSEFDETVLKKLHVARTWYVRKRSSLRSASLGISGLEVETHRDSEDWKLRREAAHEHPAAASRLHALDGQYRGASLIRNCPPHRTNMGPFA